MKKVLLLLLCLPYMAFAAVKNHSFHHTKASSTTIQLPPLPNRPIGFSSVDTLPYTMEDVRRNTKTGQLLLCGGLVAVAPPILYLAILLGTPLLAQLVFSLGALSFFLGAAKFIQSRIRLRRLRAHRRESPGG